MQNITGLGQKVLTRVMLQLQNRAFRASNELRNAELQILRGQRSGRRYRVPYTLSSKLTPSGKKRRKKYYTASAPGEAPAQLTGGLRESFVIKPRSEGMGRKRTVYPAIESPLKRAAVLEKGTQDGRIKPRPYADKIKAKALPAIRKIYKERYI